VLAALAGAAVLVPGCSLGVFKPEELTRATVTDEAGQETDFIRDARNGP
jgi:hypothetical protein